MCPEKILFIENGIFILTLCLSLIVQFNVFRN
ncbi:putative membrane protein, partial [Escherichia coli FRIK1985]